MVAAVAFAGIVVGCFIVVLTLILPLLGLEVLVALGVALGIADPLELRG